MTGSPDMCCAWLYLSQGVEALPQLVHALSIPVGNVVAGDDAQAVAANTDHLHDSGLHQFEEQGDFALSCDVRLAGWTIDAVHIALQRLSLSGMRIAMADDASDSAFAFILFESGSSRPITVVQKDETGEVTIYPMRSEQLSI
jgi:hypothetical protein